MTDFALVVGIGQYPDLSKKGVAENLAGPDHDALAVHDWLVDPAGGKLQPENVTLLRSADFAPLEPDDPQPAQARIQRCFQRLVDQTADTPGDRLYLYFSGHGFSPVLEEGALFTADATLDNPLNVYAHAWLRWFRTAQRFRETVLWMDSCMNYQQSVPPGEPTLRVKVGTSVPGPTFIALAAQTKSALEYPMADDQVHGVFTWTLLKGLAGGAADERGRVTGDSLRTFLYTVMPEFLPTDVHNSNVVDLQPFVRADEGMVFKRLPARPTYPVGLHFPDDDAAGAELRIWTGRPLSNAVTTTLDGAAWSGELLRGLYVAEVPAAGLRQGFQVSGAGPVELTVDRPGPAVVVPAGTELFALDVVPGNPAAVISVLDFRMERAFNETGELHERDIPGVYKVRVEFGRDLTKNTDEVLLLDRDTQLGRSAAPPLFSPAPIPGTAAVHDFHVTAFEDVVHENAGPKPGRAVVSLLARYWSESGVSEHRHPMEGLTLVNAAGRRAGDPLEQGTVSSPVAADPVAVWEREVSPGAYYLRQAGSGRRRYESCVVTCPDWVTHVAVRRSPRGPAALVDDAAVFMRRPGTDPSPDQDAVVEAARLALGQGRNLCAEGRGALLADLLLSKFVDPIAGIIGGHLLLRGMDAGPPDPARVQQFDTAVANLRSLVGTGHPDVEALSLRCADPDLRARSPFTMPPMFRSSWQLLTEASYDRPELCPVELWQRVHAMVVLGPYLAWASDRTSRDRHARQLSGWMARFEQGQEAARPGRGAAMALGGPAIPETVRASAYRLQVPAAATAVLWTDGRSA